MKRIRNKNLLKKLSVLSLMGIVIVLAGCSGASGSHTPLGSLKDMTKSAQFNDAFWGLQMDKNPSLWRKAEALCQQDPYKTRPNCVTVNTLAFFSVGDTSTHYQDKGFGPNDVPRPH